MKYFIVICMILIIGCTFSRATTMHTVGKNIKSVYVTGDIDVNYIAKTELGFFKYANRSK
jgi:hypothetical protein